MTFTQQKAGCKLHESKGSYGFVQAEKEILIAYRYFLVEYRADHVGVSLARCKA